MIGDVGDLIAAVAALVAAAVGMMPAWKRWSLKRRRHLTLEGMRRLQQIHDALDAMRLHGADRAVVFAGHNCGGIPRPGVPYYTSALYWSASERSMEVIPSYKRLPVDAHYIGMLIECEAEGKYRFDVAQHRDCQLKSYYEYEGVTDSWVYFLGLVDGNFLYLSVAKTGGAFGAEELVPIELEVERIRNHV